MTRSAAARKGLWRLMLKLPALRGGLQIFAARSPHLDDLFEAYEIAAVALADFRKEGNCPKAQEYENICQDIETDLIQYLLQVHSEVPE